MSHGSGTRPSMMRSARTDPPQTRLSSPHVERRRRRSGRWRARIATLVGQAGTGKTTMLRALCSQPEVVAGGVLLLAPTGKARVQLGDKAGASAKTLAQYLRPHRWDPDRGYRLNPDAPREGGFRTVVLDEASMLTEEMFAALIESLQGVHRLILCGDHRQLPPIGAGRPFADLVSHLEALRGADMAETGGGYAELRIFRRQLPTGSQTSGTVQPR